MQADPEERVQSPGGGMPSVPILAVIVVVVALGVWVFFGRGAHEPQVAAPPPVVQPAPVPEPEPEPVPDIPEPLPEPAAEAAAEPEPPPQPAMALEDSDVPLREALVPVLDSELLAGGLAADNLIERGAAIIDGLSRGVFRHKLLPLAPPAGKFPVIGEGSQGVMDPAGYRRYDPYTRAIDALEIDSLVAVFHRFRPLLEEAYALLGYEAADFDNALIRGLDLIVDAPIVEGRIEVRRVEAVYKYEDPDLEQLPGLHRQMLRMGPDNTRILKAKARQLRDALLAQ